MFRPGVVSRHERDVILLICAALSLLLVVTFIAERAYSQDCIDYRDYLHWVGGVDTPGEAVDVAVEGNYAYVADVGAGLQVVGISGPAAPRIVGSAVGASRGVAVAGDYAYVADEVSGLEVIAVSDPTSPAIVGTVAMPATAWNVAVAGNHAYVADGDAGLQVVDVSNAAAPAIVGSIAMPDLARDVAVAADYAYVAVSHAGFCVVDISNPSLPATVGSCATPGSARAVVVAGSYAYVADFDFGGYGSSLHVVDISNPASPSIVGSALMGGHEALGVAAAGSEAYIMCLRGRRGSMEVVDISDPTSPTILGGIATWGKSPVVPARRPQGVVVAGDHAYIADSEAGLQIVDVSNPLPPPVVGAAIMRDPSDVAISGHYAYVATYVDGFQVVDVSDPSAPTIVFSGGGERYFTAVAVSGDYAYLAGRWLTAPASCPTTFVFLVMILDISNPVSPTVVGSVGFEGLPSDVALAGDYAYVTDSDYGALFIVDVSDPTQPYEVGMVYTVGQARGVAVEGSYAYVANTSGLRVVDVSDPVSPVIIGGVATPGSAYDVEPDGDHAYISDEESGLLVVDISDPASPIIIGGVATPGWAPGLAVAGDFAYMAGWTSGLWVVDISNPAAPFIVGGAHSLPWNAREAVVTDDCVYLADSFGLIVCPTQCAGATPVELAWYEITTDGGVVKIAWQTSLASDHLGFHVERTEIGRDRFVRVNDELIAGADDPSSRYEFVDRSVELGQTYVYRLVAVDLSGCTQTFALGSVTVGGVRPRAIVLHQNQPNPFGASTSIAFDAQGAAPVALRIYDAHGRLVRILADGNVARGTGSFEWDGRDDRGRRLGTGVYVYRLCAGDQTLSKRLLMLR